MAGQLHSETEKQLTLRQMKRYGLCMLLIGLPINFSCIGFLMFWAARTLGSAQYLFTQSDVYFCEWNLAAGLLLFFIIFLCTIPIGLMTANICMWLIPPVRRIMNSKMPFTRAMKQLAYAALIIEPIGIALAFCLINVNTCYSDKAIIYRPLPFAAPKIYDVARLESVRAYCRWSGGKSPGWIARFEILTGDGTTFEPGAGVGLQRIPYEKIAATLHRLPFDYSDVSPNCPEWQRNRLRQISPGS